MTNISIQSLTAYLNEELQHSSLPDYPQARNGLQLENTQPITKIASAVDASLPVIKQAIANQANLLIVHHGLFWQDITPLTGVNYQKIKLALENDLAIYSSHIPLDVHPIWGNNSVLAQSLGLDISSAEPFHDFKGIKLGLKFKINSPRQQLKQQLTELLGDRVHLCEGGAEQCQTLGIITGGAGSEIAAIAEQGIDTFITGEGPHWSYPLAQELGVNLFYAGHYATETFGVRALSAHLQEKFDLEHLFIDEPSGL